MHFSKTYTQILLALPPEMREKAIEYGKLKKLVKDVVLELSSYGLSPPILHKFISECCDSIADKDQPLRVTDPQAEDLAHALSKVVYELGNADHLEPRLRLSIGLSHSPQLEALLAGRSSHNVDPLMLYPITPQPEMYDRVEVSNEYSVLEKLPLIEPTDAAPIQRELVIPLVADAAFFTLLAHALEALKNHLDTIHSDFLTTLRDLTATISSSARPMSSSASFHPYSILSSDPSTSLAPSSAFSLHSTHSDLYTWRGIFQLYMEMDVFESTKETSRGENSVAESERRLQLFVSQMNQRGLTDQKRFKSKDSRKALDTFLRMNSCILDIKKFHTANTEAARKILKKHAKLTCLPLPQDRPSLSGAASHDALLISLTSPVFAPLPHMLVQALGETLLPVIPHIDDYTCLICTSIAFKPIRLACGHLFCVRCLVKMQTRGSRDCPMCRSPCVLAANRSNLDWAMLNFMQDWFPKETRSKIKQNEAELVEEQLAELGINSQQGCIIM